MKRLTARGKDAMHHAPTTIFVRLFVDLASISSEKAMKKSSCTTRGSVLFCFLFLWALLAWVFGKRLED